MWILEGKKTAVLPPSPGSLLGKFELWWTSTVILSTWNSLWKHTLPARRQGTLLWSGVPMHVRRKNPSRCCWVGQCPEPRDRSTSARETVNENVVGFQHHSVQINTIFFNLRCKQWYAVHLSICTQTDRSSGTPTCLLSFGSSSGFWHWLWVRLVAAPVKLARRYWTRRVGVEDMATPT